MAELEFKGLVFIMGVELLPSNLVLSLERIREWAINAGLVGEPDDQFITEETISDISGVYSSDDSISVGIVVAQKMGDLDT